MGVGQRQGGGVNVPDLVGEAGGVRGMEDGAGGGGREVGSGWRWEGNEGRGE